MKKNAFYFLILAISLSSIYSCHKDDSSSDSTANTTSENNISATITGIVLDENNNPVSAVAVSTSTSNTSTDQNGIFILKDASVNKDRCTVKFSKGGYFDRSHSFIAAENSVNYVRIVMVNNAATNYVNASGGTVSLADGSSIVFPANAFVNENGSAYNGTVNLSVKHLSPDAANFGFMIPGGDLKGKNLSNADVMLYTYGMMGVELKGASGETIKIAPGITVTLNMSIAASQQASAPSTVPLWYFDESSSLWKEEGSATKIGNTYSGTVSHFTWWNCDHPTETDEIQGKVMDCTGAPMANVVVTLNGWATLLTDQYGRYHSWVPSSTAFTVQVVASNNNGIIQDSQIENVPAMAPNVIWIVADLVVPCPSTISGRIKNCNGNFIDGLVYVSWSAGGVYQYANAEDSGAFNLPCPANAQVDVLVYAHTGGTILSYSHQYQTLALGNVLDIGAVSLCDSMAEVHLNNITINGGQFSNYDLTLINVYNSAVNFDSTSNNAEAFSYGYTGEYYLTYDIKLTDTIPGSYPFTAAIGNSFPYLYFQNGVDTFSISTFGMYCGPGTINLLHFGAIGERVTGNFSGIATLERINHFGQTPVTITGNFDVIRNH